MIIGKIGTGQTIGFAVEELVRILKEMDPKLFVQERTYDAVEENRTDILWVGLDGSVVPSEDDEIRIAVQDGAGVITGSNERSVLQAVYRMLFELGCRFLRPGREGERIPKQNVDKAFLQVQVTEKASYRHRAICIEGAVSYSHVHDMLDWIPKVGMNGYFAQFMVPHCFFSRWYSHWTNPNLTPESFTIGDAKHLWSRLEEEVHKRGLRYHAVGHGWTCGPLGIEAGGWDKYTGEVDPEIKQYFAFVDGKRELWDGIALNTQLCYSNRAVRDKMTDAIVAHCQKYPRIDYLHFWLADAYNNQCECPECKKMRPADYYVMALNELDEKMTAIGIGTKIVFLLYVDLLWEPQQCRIQNPDRFVLMFAPITRTYTKALVDRDTEQEITLTPFVRNKLAMPKSVEENIARLSRWQQQFDGDSFDFDYHMMWDHVLDPGYYECARVLHRDMVNLDKIGLNGMVSCQVQRAFFPTGLPMYAMAKGLWDKTSQFEDVAKEYFTADFGEDAQAVETYLSTLSGLFHPPYLRGELPKKNKDLVADFAQIKEVVAAFRKAYLDHRVLPDDKHLKNQAWKYLFYHAHWCEELSEAMRCRASGDMEACIKKVEELRTYLNDIEIEVHSVLDVQNCSGLLKGLVN